MPDNIRFVLCAVLLALGVFAELCAVFGANRFGAGINRIHAAGMADSLGVLFIMLSAIVYFGWDFASLKAVCVVVFLWVASPVSGHLIGRLAHTAQKDTLPKEEELWKS